MEVSEMSERVFCIGNGPVPETPDTVIVYDDNGNVLMSVVDAKLSRVLRSNIQPLVDYNARLTAENLTQKERIEEMEGKFKVVSEENRDMAAIMGLDWEAKSKKLAEAEDTIITMAESIFRRGLKDDYLKCFPKKKKEGE